MPRHFKSIGTSKSYVNGKLINNRGYNIKFNGQKMNISIKKNKNKTIYKMTRGEIRRLRNKNKTKQNKQNKQTKQTSHKQNKQTSHKQNKQPSHKQNKQTSHKQNKQNKQTVHLENQISNVF